MKPFLRLPLAVVFFALIMGITSAQAWADCQNCVANLKLPPSPGAAVALSEHLDPSATSFITATLYLTPAGLDIHDGDYNAWCVDTPAISLTNWEHYTSPVSTYSPLNAIPSLNWPKINYLLNHKAPSATFHDIQRDIWLLLGQTPSTGFDQTDISLAMLNEATKNGAGFVPGAGQVVGVVLGEDGPGGLVQDVMIEIPAPPCGATLGDYVFQDTNRDGLQNLGEPGINGVTLTLQNASGAFVATATTGNTPPGYGYLTPGAPGYYQFTGLCAGTYKVVLDDNQPALGGYFPTSPLVGYPGNAAIDSNHSSGDLVTLTDTSVDETIDFGYVTVSPLTVACTPTPGLLNAPYSYTIGVTGGVPQYTFTPLGTLPAGLTVDSTTGVISGTPTAYGATSFNVQVKDATGRAAGTQTTSCTINVPAPPLTLTCSNVTSGQAGVPFSSPAMTVTGGIAPYAFSLAAGNALPAGLTLNAGTGAITGIPTAAGTFNIQVTDSKLSVATGACPFTIKASLLPLTILCPTGVGQAGVPYSSTPATAGGSGGYTYALAAGSLPNGLSLNPATGTVSGTPTAAGVFNFSVVVTDSLGHTASSNCTAACGSNAGTWNFISPLGKLGTSQQYTVNGIAITAYGFSNANAPKALYGRNDPGNEAGLGIAGTPENEIDVSNYVQLDFGALIAAGATSAQMVVNSVQSGEGYNVYGSNTPGNIGTALLSNQTSNNVPFTIPNFATYRYVSVRASAANVLLGAISATFPACNIMIAPAPLSVTCSAFNSGEAGVPFNSPGMNVSGGVAPYSFSVGTGTLPAGLNLNASTGAITGTPSAAGTFTIQVTDSKGVVAIGPCPFTIIAAPALTCPAVSSGNVGVPFSSPAMTVGGGTAPYTFSVATGTLPGGLALNASTGAISGTPTATGTFSIQVKDAKGSVATGACPFTIKAPLLPLTILCPTGVGQVGVPYTSTPATAGGSGVYTYALAAGSLPSGLTFNPITGTISGTPTAAGVFNFSLVVTDSLGHTASSSCTASCGSNAGTWNFISPLGKLGASQQYTVNGIAITAYGFSNANAPKALYGRNDPGKEAGLGIAGTPENEIDVSNYVQLDFANLIAAGATSAQMVVNSVQSGEGYTVYGSGTLGSIGTALTSNQTSNNVPFAIPGFPAYRYVSVRASAANVLLGAISATFPACNITIAPGALSVTCSAVNSGKVGVPLNSPAMNVSGGVAPFTFSVGTGTLPAGLTLNAATGAITGTPTAAGTFAIKVKDASGSVATSSCSFTIVSVVTQSPVSGDTATIGFWHNKDGQALINSLNGGPASKGLASWLATTLPYLYGPNNANNLTNRTNADVAALFSTFFDALGQKTNAQILACALASYVTNSSLAGKVAEQYGFTVSAVGMGMKTYNVDSNGTAIGLSNKTSYTVTQLLQQANLRRKTGSFDADAFNSIFDDINQTGDINGDHQGGGNQGGGNQGGGNQGGGNQGGGNQGGGNQGGGNQGGDNQGCGNHGGGGNG